MRFWPSVKASVLESSQVLAWVNLFCCRWWPDFRRPMWSLWVWSGNVVVKLVPLSNRQWRQLRDTKFVLLLSQPTALRFCGYGAQTVQHRSRNIFVLKAKMSYWSWTLWPVWHTPNVRLGLQWASNLQQRATRLQWYPWSLTWSNAPEQVRSARVRLLQFILCWQMVTILQTILLLTLLARFWTAI